MIANALRVLRKMSPIVVGVMASVTVTGCATHRGVKATSVPIQRRPVEVPPKDTLWSIAPLVDGTLLLSSSDGSVQHYDPSRKHLIAAKQAHDGQAVTHLAVSPDGERFVSAGKDATVVVWTLNSMEPEARYRIPKEIGEDVQSLHWSPKHGGLLLINTSKGRAALSVDGYVRYARVSTYVPPDSECPNDTVLVEDLAYTFWSPGCTNQETRPLDGMAEKWEITTGETLVLEAMELGEGAWTYMAASRDSKGEFVVGVSNAFLETALWRLTSADVRSHHTLAGTDTGYIREVVHGEGVVFVALKWPGFVLALSDKSLEQPRIIEGPEQPFAMALSVDGKTLFVGYRFGALAKFDVASWKGEAVLMGGKPPTR